MKVVRELLDRIEADHRCIGGIICVRINITAYKAECLFRDAQTMLTEQARNRGIIHDVTEVSLPLGHPILCLVFKRQGVYNEFFFESIHGSPEILRHTDLHGTAFPT